MQGNKCVEDVSPQVPPSREASKLKVAIWNNQGSRFLGGGKPRVKIPGEHTVNGISV